MALTLETARNQRSGALAAHLTQKLLGESCLTDTSLARHDHHAPTVVITMPGFKQAREFHIAPNKGDRAALWQGWRWRRG